MRALREVGVHVYRLDQDTASNGIHTYGMPAGSGRRRRAAEGHAVDPDEPAAEALAAGDPRRGPVHPVQLLLRRRDVVVRAPARARRRRPPDAAAAGRHADDRGRRGQLRRRSRRRRRTSTRSTPTRWRRSRSSSTCSTRASTSTAATARVRRGRRPLRQRCRARRRRLAGRAAAPTSRRSPPRRSIPVTRPEQLPGRAQAAGQAEDRPLHRQARRARPTRSTWTSPPSTTAPRPSANRPTTASAVVDRDLLRGAVRADAEGPHCRRRRSCR